MSNISDLNNLNDFEITSLSYKYQSEIDKLELKNYKCPPEFSKIANQKAYRWVFSPYKKDCFNPPAIKSPLRANNNKASEEDKCGLFGMSMHISIEASIKAFLFLEKTNRKLREKMATHIAEGTLMPSHGVCTEEDEFGHFDFYEYKNNNCTKHFSVIQEIPKS